MTANPDVPATLVKTGAAFDLFPTSVAQRLGINGEAGQSKE
jgi:hypothetical protein